MNVDEPTKTTFQDRPCGAALPIVAALLVMLLGLLALAIP